MAIEAAEEESLADLRGRYDIELVRAPNPGPLTLTGTNSWVVGRSPAWVVDPGPAIDSHIDRLVAEVGSRGGLGGILLTHDHNDHSEGIDALRAREHAPLAASAQAARGPSMHGGLRAGSVDVPLADSERFGPFEAVATPGHAPDHLAYVASGACFTGDAVLGSGSVFVSPHEGAMGGYLRALAKLRARDDYSVICPGHGPIVWDPFERLDEYVGHRLDREHRLIAALAAGRRSVRELLDDVWSDVPATLRPAATATLAAHLDKLDEEHVLPTGVERPEFGTIQW
ncbi:MAG TPA: MBL fold metallo-hydrolase [Solirubrobacteraceae bacterium]|nr:MBL fold metallo-hydrolase [Solirubrobacteraceae bacterium]